MNEFRHGLVENSGVNRDLILTATASFIALLIFGTAFSWYAFREPIRAEMATQPHFSRMIFAKPRLQVAPEEMVFELRSHEDQVLNSYGWIDEKKRVARIPISRAMELVQRKHLLGIEAEHAH